MRRLILVLALMPSFAHGVDCSCNLASGKPAIIAASAFLGKVVTGYSTRNGNFLAAWSGFASIAAAQVFGVSGSRKGARILLGPRPIIVLGTAYNPDQQEFLLLSTDGAAHLRAHFIKDTGGTIRGPVVILTSVSENQFVNSGLAVYDPVQKAYLLLYTVTETSFRIFLQQLDSSGILVGTRAQVNQKVHDSLFDPLSLSRNNNSGELLVTWIIGEGMRYQFFNSHLERIGTNRIMAPFSQDQFLLTSVASMSDRTFAVFWNERKGTLVGRILNSNGIGGKIRGIAGFGSWLQNNNVQALPEGGFLISAGFGPQPPIVIAAGNSLDSIQSFQIGCTANQSHSGMQLIYDSIRHQFMGVITGFQNSHGILRSQKIHIPETNACR